MALWVAENAESVMRVRDPYRIRKLVKAADGCAQIYEIIFFRCLRESRCKRDLDSAIRDRRKKDQQDRQLHDRRRKELEKQVASYLDAIGERGLRDSRGLASRLKSAEQELASIDADAAAPADAPLVAFEASMVRYRGMVSMLSEAAGPRVGEVRDALREMLGQVRVGLDGAGRVYGRTGMQLSDGSGGED